jgi:hypothetical protein
MKEPERIDPAQTAGVNPPGITAAKRKRDRSWEAAHAGEVASYRLPLELKAAVRDLAESLDVSPADIARVLLEHGLADYKSGKLKLIVHK